MKIFKISLFFLTLLFSCTDQSNEEMELNNDANIIIGSANSLDRIPDFIADGFSDSSGRQLSEIEDVSRVQYSSNEEEKSQIVLTIKSTVDTAKTTVLYDEDLQVPTLILHEVLLEDNYTQLNYFTPDGQLLLFQLEGKDGQFMYTYKYDEAAENNDSRVLGCYTSVFMGCVDQTTSTTTFKVLALASAFTGTYGYVAGGLVVGCGLGSLGCFWNNRAIGNKVGNSLLLIQRNPRILTSGTRRTQPLYTGSPVVQFSFGR